MCGTDVVTASGPSIGASTPTMPVTTLLLWQAESPLFDQWFPAEQLGTVLVRGVSVAIEPMV